MLDIKFIRENPERVKEGCRKKQVNVDIDHFLVLDSRKRELLQKIENLRHQKRCQAYARHRPGTGRTRGTSEGEGQVRDRSLWAREMRERIKELKQQFKQVKEEFVGLMLQIPNLPLPDVPEGKDESENKIIKKVGEIKTKNVSEFTRRDHLEIGERMDLIDVKRAAKVAGSRFGYLKNEAVLLEFALINFALDFLTKKGFIPVIPPVLIKPAMMQGMAYLDLSSGFKVQSSKLNEEVYFLKDDDLVLVATSEQSIGTMHQGEIFEEKELPRRYLAFSSCFRREAGSYGKDTRGILRVHQFDKLEMFSFCKPEDSEKEHQFLLTQEGELMQKLKLPYQVVQLCTGDLSRPSASTFDIETWLPGQGRYRETHSCSNCTDFQSRRLNTRYRNSKTKKLQFVHTLNGTVFAIGRMLIAILENYQQPDGKIGVPKALQKYTGFKIIGS